MFDSPSNMPAIEPLRNSPSPKRSACVPVRASSRPITSSSHTVAGMSRSAPSKSRSTGVGGSTRIAAVNAARSRLSSERLKHSEVSALANSNRPASSRSGLIRVEPPGWRSSTGAPNASAIARYSPFTSVATNR